MKRVTYAALALMFILAACGDTRIQSEPGEIILAPGESVVVRCEDALPTPTATSTAIPPTVTPQPTHTATATTVPAVLIIDDADPGFSTEYVQDAWGVYSKDDDAQLYGGSHHYNRELGTGQDVATWAFDVPPGWYSVSAWWYASDWRPSDVPYTVHHADGAETVRVDQRANGGQWNLLGTFRFEGAGSVSVSDDCRTGDRGVIADAIRLEYQGAQPTATPQPTGTSYPTATSYPTPTPRPTLTPDPSGAYAISVFNGYNAGDSSMIPELVASGMNEICRGADSHAQYGIIGGRHEAIAGSSWNGFGSRIFADPAYVQEAKSRLNTKLIQRYMGNSTVFGYELAHEPWADYNMSIDAWRSVVGGLYTAETGETIPNKPPAGAPRSDVLAYYRFMRWRGDKFSEYIDELNRYIQSKDPTKLGFPFMNGLYLTEPNSAGESRYQSYAFDYDGLGATDYLYVDSYPGWRVNRTTGAKYPEFHYMVGYSSRLMVCLTGQRVNMMPQAHRVGPGYAPTVEEIRTWTEDALRAGVAGISWFQVEYVDGGYSTIQAQSPERWQAVLAINRAVAGANRLPVPQADTAVFIPFDTYLERKLNNLLAAYAEMYEARIHIDFVAAREIQSGEKWLGDYKVVYVPAAGIIDESAILSLRDYLESGGVVVVQDVGAFQSDIDNNSLAHYRRQFFGVTSTSNTSSKSVILNQQIGDLGAGTTLSIALSSASVTVEDGVTVLARWSDGAPAIVEKRHGAGRAIFSGAQFLELGLINPKPDPQWYEFYLGLQSQAGAKNHSWIWDINLDNMGDYASE